MRVIAGELGGRRLSTPGGRETRPTSDRVREALFMALEPLAGLRVVDLFAGSGALGIEALSRGASHADFVESATPAIVVLKRNLDELGLNDRAMVWRLDLQRGLKVIAASLESADLVLMDPPYQVGLTQSTLEMLGRPGVLREGARVVAEHHAKEVIPDRAGTLELVRARKYGETSIRVYRCGTER